MSISFRPLARSDYLLLRRWLAEPHVAVWWNEQPDVEAKYGPRIDGREPVHVYVIEQGGVPIGWIQWYRWCDFPEHAARLGADASDAGVDLAIGEVAMIGLGLGPAALREFGTKYVFADANVSAIVADPAMTNTRSVRAFEKAGYGIVRTLQLPGEGFDRAVVRLCKD